jgi:hypothetical protein
MQYNDRRPFLGRYDLRLPSNDTLLIFHLPRWIPWYPGFLGSWLMHSPSGADSFHICFWSGGWLLFPEDLLYVFCGFLLRSFPRRSSFTGPHPTYGNSDIEPSTPFLGYLHFLACIHGNDSEANNGLPDFPHHWVGIGFVK